MKKLVLIMFCFLAFNSFGETLKGGVYEEYIPKGFFGSWGVISKLQQATNPSKFNFESRDIWLLSGQGNTLILQNLESGAYSEIIIKDKSPEGKTLKFNRQKTINTKEGKQIHKETVQFTLSKNNFSGTDNFIVEDYDLKGNLLRTNSAIYDVEGVRF